MPRSKQKPIVQVLAFFETSDLLIAETALDLVETIVKNRLVAERGPSEPAAPVKPRRPHRKKKPQDQPLPSAEGKTLIEEMHERAAQRG